MIPVVVNEVTPNPNWLSSKAGKEANNLRTVLSAAMTVLRNRADQRPSPSTGVEVLAVAIRTVGLRLEFLDRMPPGIAPGQPIIAAALDAMMAAVFNHPPKAVAAWQLLR